MKCYIFDQGGLPD